MPLGLYRSKTMLADGQTAKFLYTINKQLDMKSVDWSAVASELCIPNGHAARMRFHRLRAHMEGIPSTPRNRVKKSTAETSGRKRAAGEISKIVEEPAPIPPKKVKQELADPSSSGLHQNQHNDISDFNSFSSTLPPINSPNLNANNLAPFNFASPFSINGSVEEDKKPPASALLQHQAISHTTHTTPSLGNIIDSASSENLSQHYPSNLMLADLTRVKSEPSIHSASPSSTMLLNPIPRKCEERRPLANDIKIKIEPLDA
ncbi:MAG: hypothetical protein M1834_005769 [Cirrosporium novae-zelandiae]|nr:MAG: hypothetical protein M1834_005769 [Cirrosporium novae-zelandiae]